MSFKTHSHVVFDLVHILFLKKTIKHKPSTFDVSSSFVFHLSVVVVAVVVVVLLL